jgi:type VI secretion system protein ImpH
MAGQGGGSSFNLKLDLLGKGHEFSFFQALRLLRLFHPPSLDSAEGTESRKEERIRVRPELSLAFPASDVTRIEELGDETPVFQVTATLLGLYGSSSPLPTFYTEDLLDEEAEDQSVTRDFIDILNHRLFLLLFRCWTKYRQFLQVVEEKNPKDLEKLFCLLGLGEKELREDLSESYPLLRYTGLLTQFPRSALGLKTLLQDALGMMPIEVVPCVRRTVKIPPDQRFYLGASGSCLGKDSFLGEEIDDRMGKFCLRVGPLKSESFHSLLPQNPNHQRLVFLTQFYINEPLEYDLELILAEEEAGPIRLGGPMWSRLGWDTWTFSTDHLGEVRATFPPQSQ